MLYICLINLCVLFEPYSLGFISQLTEICIFRNTIISHYGHWLGQVSKMLLPQLGQQNQLFQKMLFGSKIQLQSSTQKVALS